MFEQESEVKWYTVPVKKESFGKPAKKMHALYVDDRSEAEAINLKKQLIRGDQ